MLQEILEGMPESTFSAPVELQTNVTGLSEKTSLSHDDDPVKFSKNNESAEPAESQAQNLAEEQETAKKILKQVEFYFGDANLPTDNFLMKHVKSNDEGWVVLKVVAGFRKMKNLKPKSQKFVADSLRGSELLEVNAKGSLVRRRRPLPETLLLDIQERTVVAEHLGEHPTIKGLEEMFGKVGTVNTVRICQPGGANRSSQQNVGGNLVQSGMLHALVEYDCASAALRAVKELTDDNNWRSGLKVKLLSRTVTHPFLPIQGNHPHPKPEGSVKKTRRSLRDGLLSKEGSDQSRNGTPTKTGPLKEDACNRNGTSKIGTSDHGPSKEGTPKEKTPKYENSTPKESIGGPLKEQSSPSNDNLGGANSTPNKSRRSSRRSGGNESEDPDNRTRSRETTLSPEGKPPKHGTSPLNSRHTSRDGSDHSRDGTPRKHEALSETGTGTEAAPIEDGNTPQSGIKAKELSRSPETPGQREGDAESSTPSSQREGRTSGHEGKPPKPGRASAHREAGERSGEGTPNKIVNVSKEDVEGGPSEAGSSKVKRRSRRRSNKQSIKTEYGAKSSGSGSESGAGSSSKALGAPLQPSPLQKVNSAPADKTGCIDGDASEWDQGGRKKRRDYKAWASAETWKASHPQGSLQNRSEVADARPMRLHLNVTVHHKDVSGLPTPKKPDGTKGFSRGRGKPLSNVGIKNLALGNVDKTP